MWLSFVCLFSSFDTTHFCCGGFDSTDRASPFFFDKSEPCAEEAVGTLRREPQPFCLVSPIPHHPLLFRISPTIPY